MSLSTGNLHPSARWSVFFRALSFAPWLFGRFPLNLYTPSRFSPPWRRRAHPRSSHRHPAHAAPSAQEAGHVVAGPGRVLRDVYAPLRAAVVPLPPRRAAPQRAAPDLQGRRQDALGLRAPGTTPRGPRMAGRTPTSEVAPPRDP